MTYAILTAARFLLLCCRIVWESVRHPFTTSVIRMRANNDASRTVKPGSEVPTFTAAACRVVSPICNAIPLPTALMSSTQPRQLGRALIIALAITFASGICGCSVEEAHPTHQTLDWVAGHCKKCPDCDAALRRRLKDNDAAKPPAEVSP